MYRCVRVTLPDSYFQCILWRDSPQKHIEIFKLDTVTCGTKSASFSPCAQCTSWPLMSVWCSSHQEVLEGIAYEDREQYLKLDDGSDVTKALALKDKLTWDESLPIATWRERCSSIRNIRHVSFPGVVLFAGADVEIHGFCDASVDAYGACIYVVARSPLATSRILCSKSRVVPLKTLTVPKLELCGAKLLANLMHEVKRTGIFVSQFYCWCDSSVVLTWIRDETFKFNVFVANRVTAIQELTTSMEWRYVPTDRNLADILSRGTVPDVLAQSELWFHGPSYLLDGRLNWPASCLPETPTIELRVLIIKSPHADLTLGCKHTNSFGSMQRTFGSVYKFLKRIRHHGLTVDDIHHGTRILLWAVQRANLWDDIKEIHSHGNVKKSSSIASLAPFLDEGDFLRIGGRLSNSSLDYDAQHPIILPRRHAITLALIVQFQERNLHTGPRALLAKIRL
ncbi:uncharacterized protein LOC135440397 [Drosophila montana]|uniref:uncharacterized protein LOC135440397 n=1 Tax=Drosophila montana TaxID=40370 RepID=UPI00313F03A2